MRKITKSLLMITAVVALTIGGTIAYFSDTETSIGNIFTAGAIDLKVDSTEHYNNAVCVNNAWALEPTGTATASQYPVIGSVCGGTWGQTQPGVDITNEKFFNFGDIKPGDFGENTISLHVVNNDAWVCAEVSNLTNFENGINEAEAFSDTTTGVNEGELQNAMVWKVWRDDGDNIWETGETILSEGQPVNGVLPVYDSTTATGALIGGTTGYLGFSWSLPSATGNAVQTDSLTGNISFKVVQSRNNANFNCASVTPPGGEDNGAALGPLPVNLLSADNFAIVAKTAITDANPSLSALTGNVAIDPTAGSAVTGLSCSHVTGTIYSSGGYTGGYNSNTACALTDPVTALAVRSDMETAYGDAAGRTLPTATELGAGNIGGQTLAPGLYKWSTDVTIPTDVTLSGDANDVWIFQIAGDLNVASGGSPSGGADVILSGGALAKNVFWQVGGGTGATLGTYSTFRGTILSSKQIILQSGAVLYGRALSQTQVTLDANAISLP